MENQMLDRLSYHECEDGTLGAILSADCECGCGHRYDYCHACSTTLVACDCHEED